MKTAPIFIFLLAVHLFTACGTSDATHEGHVPGAAEMGPEHGGQTDEVQLDKGQRWTANIETTEGVNRMLAMVNGYDPASPDTLLKSRLVAEFNEIFAKCTMTGMAHQQLHKFLAPVHGILDKMGAMPTAAELSQIRDHLKTYGNYFR